MELLIYSYRGEGVLTLIESVKLGSKDVTLISGLKVVNLA